VIEVIDFLQMLALIAAALNLVRKNVEIEPIGILGRDQMHFPEREKQGDNDSQSRGNQEKTRPEI
jgi:hypothetical protein